MIDVFYALFVCILTSICTFTGIMDVLNLGTLPLLRQLLTNTALNGTLPGNLTEIVYEGSKYTVNNWSLRGSLYTGLSVFIVLRVRNKKGRVT